MCQSCLTATDAETDFTGWIVQKGFPGVASIIMQLLHQATKLAIGSTWLYTVFQGYQDQYSRVHNNKIKSHQTTIAANDTYARAAAVCKSSPA